VRLAFEELDAQDTRMGEISLRRRLDLTLGVDVYEVKLGDEFLMSSLFTVAERALATLSLAELPAGGDSLDVVVGGLGLGYTAQAALADERVRSLQVVEALAPVIDWHERSLLPLTDGLAADPRCRLVEGDFFALVADGTGLDALDPRRFHAVLLDIDHTPSHVLDPSHAAFYEPAGLERLQALLHPGGVFGLWSDAAPDDEFLASARAVFTTCLAHVVEFPNPLTGATSSNTVYVAR
jgi:spermidine synthase